MQNPTPSQEVNPIIVKSNIFLAFLKNNGETLWRTEIILNNLTIFNNDASSVIAKVEKKIKSIYAVDAFCINIGSTPSIIDKCFDSSIIPSETQQIIDLLKKNNRIMQIGGGRGKCLLVLFADPLNANVTVEESDISINQIKKMVKSLEKKIINDQADMHSYKERMDEKDEQIAQLILEKQILQAKADAKEFLSWS